MKNHTRMIALSSHVALACNGMMISAGCGTASEGPGDSPQVTEDTEPAKTLRIFRIAYSAEMVSGQYEQVALTFQGGAGVAIDAQITAIGSPTTPAADFSPATGTVTITNTIADFVTVYTPPDVTVDTDVDYQVTIRDARASSPLAITTNFTTHIKPRAEAEFVGVKPNVLFSPVVLNLTANGSKTPGAVELVATVSDDSALDQLAFQWSYEPNTGTPDAMFANNGQGNPGLFQGYTVAHQGTITLAVTDEHNGTTTLHYQLTPDQFADPIEHASVGGLKRDTQGFAP